MWIKWRKRYVFMDQAGTDGAAGGAAGAAGAAGGAAGAAGAAGNGGSGTGAANGGAAAGGTGAGSSVLAAGMAGAGTGAPDFIPEKLRVTKADGTLDMEASARKMAEAYGNLETRFGKGEAAPKEVTDYKVTVPDALKEAFDPAKDEGMQTFLKGAHEKGLNQAQLDFVMGKYFELAPQLAAGAKQYDAETATAELKKTWATDADFNRNVKNAYVGANAIAAKAGLDVKSIMDGPLGNDPTFLKLMAAMGPEFAEDAPPGGQQMTTEDDVNKLMASEAYTNPRHADHAKVSAQVKKYFDRKYGTEAAA